MLCATCLDEAHKVLGESKVDNSGPLHQIITRRRLMGAAAVGALALSRPGWAQTMIELRYPAVPEHGDHDGLSAERPDDPAAHPPPLLENAVEVFRQGCVHANDQFYVRWHWALIPTDIDINI